MPELPDDRFSELDVAIEFQPTDTAAASLVSGAFPDHDVFETDAFTGTATVVLVISAIRSLVSKALDFYVKHRASYKDATVKIGKTEISLKGYTADEVTQLFDSPAFQEALQGLRKKG